MERIRKPFEGVTNIIRFNWHFYLLSVLAILLLFVGYRYIGSPLKTVILFLAIIIFLTTIITLGVSFYIYDLSNLYMLNWLPPNFFKTTDYVVTFNAGFDEISPVLAHKFHYSKLQNFDFYNPAKHTEISIKRARKAFPPLPGTIAIDSNSIPSGDKSADKIFLFFAAHEIRDEQERIKFFKEIKRVLKQDGNLIVTEHLRDLRNFAAYNIGALHFFSRQSWLKVFTQSGLILSKEIKITPFISTFILENNGASS